MPDVNWLKTAVVLSPAPIPQRFQLDLRSLRIKLGPQDHEQSQRPGQARFGQRSILRAVPPGQVKRCQPG
jgi:hypothetical protein